MNITSTTGKKNVSRKRGVVIIMAVVMAAELVIVGAAVHAISLKEQRLSTLAEDSIRAFLAAESAIECFIFNDIRIGNFGTETPIALSCGTAWNIDYTPTSESSLDGVMGIPDNQCRTYSATSGDGNCFNAPTVGLTSIGFSGYPNGACADVYLAKVVWATGRVVTAVYANGMNSCNPTFQRLQRGIEVIYPRFW